MVDKLNRWRYDNKKHTGRIQGFTIGYYSYGVGGEKVGGGIIDRNGKDYKHLSVGHVPVFGTGGIITYVNNYLYNGDTVCIGRKGTIDKPIFYSGKIWTVDTLFYTYAFKTTFARYIYLLFQIIDWKNIMRQQVYLLCRNQQ